MKGKCTLITERHLLIIKRRKAKVNLPVFQFFLFFLDRLSYLFPGNAIPLILRNRFSALLSVSPETKSSSVSML